MRRLLLTKEKKTLAGVGGPCNVGMGSLSGLLTLLVGREGLGLNGVGAEEEELLGGNQVPGAAQKFVSKFHALAVDMLCSKKNGKFDILGEAQSLSLVGQVALLNRCDDLLLSLGLLSSLLSRLSLLSSSGGSILSRLVLGDSLNSSGSNGLLLGDLDGLLFLGHCES
jgi:hypothetical protein